MSDDAWEWGGPRKDRPPLTPSGEPLKAPAQMMQLVDNLTGIMLSMSKRLAINVEMWIAHGGDMDEVERFIQVATVVPKAAQRILDIATGVYPLPELPEKTNDQD